MGHAGINVSKFTSLVEAERIIAIFRNDIKSVLPEICFLPVSKLQKHQRSRFSSMTIKKLPITLLRNGITTTKIKIWQIYFYLKVT